MPALAPFSLTTNVDQDIGHVWDFQPFGRKDGLFTFIDPSNLQMDLRPSVTFSYSAPSKTSKLMKCRAKITLPVAFDDSVTGITRFDHNVTADLTFIAPQQSTEFHRELITAMMRQLITDTTNSPVVRVFKDAAPLY
ncbi:TPA_asm: coat protein [ssRNA phage SRR6960799_16]|uniref:Coat protein n=1 Tax=ssRNA phage SRR6960799_16 TaxID=2786572 RepID=A0A8S5L3K7_9VIRU|nr:coat protein [ssRNA phage SRR6960799_16]DAD52272.1 TPA_asm: coat protein [ssRNA phage SRR6960799_16]